MEGFTVTTRDLREAILKAFRAQLEAGTTRFQTSFPRGGLADGRSESSASFSARSWWSRPAKSVSEELT